MMYTYRVADIVKVIDGDTMDVDVDLGFYAILRVRIRLANIDTWEMFGVNVHPLGVAAHDFAEEWLKSSLESGGLILRTDKLNPEVPLSDGGFGRWAGSFTNSLGEDLSDDLRSAGFEKVRE